MLHEYGAYQYRDATGRVGEFFSIVAKLECCETQPDVVVYYWSATCLFLLNANQSNNVGFAV